MYIFSTDTTFFTYRPDSIYGLQAIIDGGYSCDKCIPITPTEFSLALYQRSKSRSSLPFANHHLRKIIDNWFINQVLDDPNSLRFTMTPFSEWWQHMDELGEEDAGVSLEGHTEG